MIEISGRKLAQIILDKIEIDNAYANLAMSEVMRAHDKMEHCEKAFCTELVYGTLRHLLKIDYLLGRLLSRNLKSLKLSVKNILRISLYQLSYLPEIPERAVIHSAVELVKHSRFSGLASLVNAVLRNYLRQKESLKISQSELDLPAYLSLEYSMPQWLVQGWLNQFGPVKTEQILRVSNERPPLTIRLNRLRGTEKQIVEILLNEGFKVDLGLILKESKILTKTPLTIEKSKAFNEGFFFVQDESSMLVAHLFQPQPNETLIDLCAAPGGKSTHLAELMGNQGMIYSVDDHDHKVKLIAQNARRLHIDCIRPQLAEARMFHLPDGQLADGVLVDAPCSGTGVFRRRVDAKYRKSPEVIRQLVTLQREILNQAATLIKSGGRLVYSTCTLEKEEDEAQVEWFLNEHPQFELEDVHQYLPQVLDDYLHDPKEKWAKILPISGGGDGFFLSRFRKL